MLPLIASYIGPGKGGPFDDSFGLVVAIVWLAAAVLAVAVFLVATDGDCPPAEGRELERLALVLLAPLAIPIALTGAFWAVSATWIATLLGARELVAALLGPDPPPLDRLPRLERIRGALPA